MWSCESVKKNMGYYVGKENKNWNGRLEYQTGIADWNSRSIAEA